MGTRSKSYEAFIKSELQAVPLGFSQQQVKLGAVLTRKGFFPKSFVRHGNLESLGTASAEVQSKLAMLPDIDEASREGIIERAVAAGSFNTLCNSSSSGVASFLFPGVDLKAWLSAKAKLGIKLYGVTTLSIKDSFLCGLINKGLWKPNSNVLRDFYVVSELVWVTDIEVTQQGKRTAGASGDAQIDPTAQLSAELKLQLSLGKDGVLKISGGEDGKGKLIPFVIAFRTAHVVYNDSDFSLKKLLELGVRRGDDDGVPLSSIIGKDPQYHMPFLDESDDALVIEDSES